MEGEEGCGYKKVEREKAQSRMQTTDLSLGDLYLNRLVIVS